MHSRALGGAIGVTAAAGLFLLTIVQLLADPTGLPIGLLSQFFYGYSLTWAGACIGAAWAGAVGFLCGWLLGLTHNLTINAWVCLVRMRAELSQRRNFIDHLR